MSNAPEIDFSKMEFPTDQYSVKHLRISEPEYLDEWDQVRAVCSGIDAPNMIRFLEGRGEVLAVTMATERELARAAFDKEFGRTPEYLSGSREEIVETLAGDYVNFLHLAAGEHHAKELIKSIERAAISQAREIQGVGPGN